MRASERRVERMRTHRHYSMQLVPQVPLGFCGICTKNGGECLAMLNSFGALRQNVHLFSICYRTRGPEGACQFCAAAASAPKAGRFVMLTPLPHPRRAVLSRKQ